MIIQHDKEKSDVYKYISSVNFRYASDMLPSALRIHNVSITQAGAVGHISEDVAGESR